MSRDSSPAEQPSSVTAAIWSAPKPWVIARIEKKLAADHRPRVHDERNEGEQEQRDGVEKRETRARPLPAKRWRQQASR